jgi:carboxyl-terminal processing protease
MLPCERAARLAGVSSPKPSRPSTWRLALLLAPFAFAGGMIADRAVSFAEKAPPPTASAYKQLDLFARVLSYVENNYVESVDSSQLIYGAIKGMMDTLDPHTLFMPPDMFKDMKVDTSGEFGGLGIEVAEKNEVLTVVTPIDDTPASRAGLKPGDQLLRIDGEGTRELGVAGAIKRMRGPPGSRCVLNIMREGFKEPRDLVILRERIRIVSVDSRVIDGYGYVKIKNFQDRTDRYLKTALDELRVKNHGELKGLVLDLRNNPGGLLDQAVRVADRFLPGGELIVSTRGRGGKHLEEERSHDRDTEPAYPLVVLVNGGSASASEIVAGALQDNKRGVVLGTQTFGKGSVQTIIELEDGSGLKLTIARYYTPKGRSIQELGITPDVVVKEGLGPDDVGPREVDLKRHFKHEGPPDGIGQKIATGAPLVVPARAEVQDNAPVAAAEDFQLKAAIDYLKAWPPPSAAARAAVH